MSSQYYGDYINQYGGHNIGKIVNESSAEQKSALLEIIRLAEDLRAHVSADANQAIDESVAIIRHGDTVERGSLRRALQSLAGIASLVGEVGVPVIEAIHKVLTALGVG